jgi:hypothetical protein
MSDSPLTAILSPPTEGPNRRAQSYGIRSSLLLLPSHRPGGATGHISYSPIRRLNNDILLNIFYLYRVHIPDEDDDDNGQTRTYWIGERWWYKFAQVCQQWRQVIFASPIRLDLQLVCTYGTPVADMLAHSPPLPLIIYYLRRNFDPTVQDELNILLALEHRDRVCRIGLLMPPSNLRKLVGALDGQFSILERMYIHSNTPTEGDGTLVFPKTFQAPHMCHLSLRPAALPIGSRLLGTTPGLVTLLLLTIPPSTYFTPTYLHTRLSLMPQLEWLAIFFRHPLPSRYVERQVLGTPIMTHATLPNLRWFDFGGVSPYLDALLSRISAPALKKLHVWFFNQLTLTIPHVVQFFQAPEHIVIDAFLIEFQSGSVSWMIDQREKDETSPLYMTTTCPHLDWQVASTLRIVGDLSPMLSSVVQVTLRYEEHGLSSKQHNEVDRIRWRELLGPFSNLKTLRAQGGLVNKLSHSLESNDGEEPLDLLPNLQELEYSGGDMARDALTSFINERQAAGHPVILREVDF